MRVRLKLLLGALTLCANLSAHYSLAQNSEKAAPANGVYVSFVENTSPALRNQLHRKLNAALLYRSLTLPIDHIRPAAASRLRDREYLEALCAKYRGEKIVKSCDPALASAQHQTSASNASQSGTEPCPTVVALPLPSSSGVDSLRRIAHRAAPRRQRRCEVVPLHGVPPIIGANLTPFWAQEYIGADLAQERMQDAQRPLHPVRLGTFETVDLPSIAPERLGPELASIRRSHGAGIPSFERPGSRSHGTNVANLILAPAPYGVAAPGTGSLSVMCPTVAMCLHDEFIAAPYFQLTDEMFSRGVQILTMSHSTPRGPAERAMFEAIARKGIIQVQSAGNSYPTPVAPPTSSDSIVVGSLSPLGTVSSFSQSGPAVTILAPSDDYIQSRLRGNFSIFSGTSGAQPLVSGEVINAMALLPNLTAREANTLVRRTAVPTLDTRNASGNGAGMLNALQIVEVALRLQTEWPNNRERITTDPSLFDFSAESQQAWLQAQALLVSGNSCDRAEGLRLLRRAFLLQPQNIELSRQLGEFYTRQGFRGNAAFYRSFSVRTLDDLDALEFGNDDENFLLSLGRTALGFGNQGLSAALQNLNAENDQDTDLRDLRILNGTVIEGACALSARGETAQAQSLVLSTLNRHFSSGAAPRALAAQEGLVSIFTLEGCATLRDSIGASCAGLQMNTHRVSCSAAAYSHYLSTNQPNLALSRWEDADGENQAAILSSLGYESRNYDHINEWIARGNGAALRSLLLNLRALHSPERYGALLHQRIAETITMIETALNRGPIPLNPY